MQFRPISPREAEAFYVVCLSFDHGDDRLPWQALKQRAAEIVAPTSNQQGAFLLEDDGPRLVAVWGRSFCPNGRYVFIDCLPEVEADLDQRTAVWWAATRWVREQPDGEAWIEAGDQFPSFGRTQFRVSFHARVV